MMELAGIDMLPPGRRASRSSGGSWSPGPAAGEVVVGQRLGVLVEEVDATAGSTRRGARGSRGPGRWSGRRRPWACTAASTVETVLDPTAQGFLDDHRIDGTPVLPGVMGVEAFAEVARVAAARLAGARGRGRRFLAPFKFYRDEPRRCTLEATCLPGDGDDARGRLPAPRQPGRCRTRPSPR